MFTHIKNAFFYSLDGLTAAFKEEQAFRLVLLQAAGIIVFMFVFELSYVQQAFLMMAVALSLIVELINSALENTVDLVTSEWHILAKKAKDMGSAAQFIASSSIYVQLLIIFFHSV